MNDKEVVDLLISIKNYFQNDAVSWALDRAIWAIKSIESIMAERDAAVKILKKEAKDNFNLCYYCKHHSFDFCNDCDYEGSRWEWRGVEE